MTVKNFFRIILSPILLAMWLCWAAAMAVFSMMALFFVPLIWLTTDDSFLECLKFPFSLWRTMAIEMPLENSGYGKNRRI